MKSHTAVLSVYINSDWYLFHARYERLICEKDKWPKQNTSTTENMTSNEYTSVWLPHMKSIV